jgi:glycosyltransferase involved in cell wall biosynthesis
MSFGLRCLASDISANREVGVPGEQRFPAGDVAALQSLLLRYTSTPMSSELRNALIESTTRDHDWESIAEDTQAVFHAAIARKHARSQPQRPRARRRV